MDSFQPYHAVSWLQHLIAKSGEYDNMNKYETPPLSPISWTFSIYKPYLQQGFWSMSQTPNLKNQTYKNEAGNHVKSNMFWKQFLDLLHFRMSCHLWKVNII